MKFSLLAVPDLDAGLLARWRDLQRSNPALGSPFFCPEFTQAVAAVRPDVRVALLEDAGQVLGFFPHQQRWGRGLPVGHYFSDHHGVVAGPHTRWDWPALLRGARLAYWRFDHLAAAQAPTSQPLREASSPCMDLSGGLAAYRQSRLASGARSLTDYARKARRMERMLGPLRFEPQVQERSVFDALLRLKAAQYARTQVPDVMAEGWTRALLELIWQTPAADGSPSGFCGFLSALCAGDTLVAVHLGMRSERVWHWWIPAYEPAHAAYSPGVQLLMQSAAVAADTGHAVLDLGKGSERYKQEFGNSQLALVEGWVGRPALATAALAAHEQARHWLYNSALTRPLKPLARKVRAALA